MAWEARILRKPAGFEIGCGVSVECYQNKLVILKDWKILWSVYVKYDKIPVKAGGEAMNTDTTIAKNIRVADEKASYDAA